MGRWTKEPAEESNLAQPSTTRPSVERVAARLASYLTQIDEGRGLLDMLAPQRMGRHIAQSFADQHGANALNEVERVGDWIESAARVLRETGFK